MPRHPKPRSLNPQPLGGGQQPCCQALIAALLLATLPSAAIAQTGRIGLNFTGPSLFDSLFIPADPMGAVGPAQIVELINGCYRVYDKTTGNQVASSSLNDFWTAAGAAPDGRFAFDPRILYDPSTQRWYASSADNAGGPSNSFLVAVSKSANPLDGWNGFKLASDLAGTQWADIPQLGYNRDGVYLTANMFSPSDIAAVNMLVLPKADLLAAPPAGPSVANHTLFDPSPVGVYNSSWQPVVDYDNTAMPAKLFSATADTILLGEIRGPIGSPSVVKTSDVPVAFLSGPTPGHQPGTKADLDTLDNRIQGSILKRNGVYWGVQSVGIDATATEPAKAAIRWFKIDAATDLLLQEGLITDNTLDLYFPSLAVNSLGDVVIGCNGSSKQQFVSAYAIVGKTDASGSTSFGDLMLLKAGAADYQRLDSWGRNRWGDFSATVPDPSDPTSFWTFQAFVSSSDIWSTQITQIIVPEPSTLLLALTAAAALAAWAALRRRDLAARPSPPLSSRPSDRFG